jgi:hypothetical protein
MIIQSPSLPKKTCLENDYCGRTHALVMINEVRHLIYGSECDVGI